MIKRISLVLTKDRVVVETELANNIYFNKFIENLHKHSFIQQFIEIWYTHINFV